MLPGETFSPGRSALHRADPRAKLLAALIFACCTALLRSIPAAGLALLASLALVAIARPPCKPLLKRIVVVNGFIAFLWIFLPFSAPGEPILVLWELEATAEGLRLALLITLKSNAVLLAIIGLVATSDVPAIGRALSALRIPDKLALLFLISYRYLHVLAEEYQRLLTAAKIRGFQPRSNLRTYRTYAYILAMVLIKSYDRSQRVHQAMLLRGFQGRFRTLHNFALSVRDVALASAVGCMASGLAFWDLLWLSPVF